ncbi:MAG: HisA/HisF-related TIM barrel protein [Pirellulaceae bacterium]
MLGVIDLKKGRAVHAVAGRRDDYRPVCCSATTDGDAMQLARMYLATGVAGLYVADLDAITLGRPNLSVLHSLVELNAPLWLDAGIAELSGLESKYLSRVVGTESLNSFRELQDLADAWRIETSSIVVSIDLRGECVLAKSRTLMDQTHLQVASEAVELGFERFIVLDLSAVGTSDGVKTASICNGLSKKFPSIEIATGGGVRSTVDIQALRKQGCRYVLVGTALHNCGKNFNFTPRFD